MGRGGIENSNRCEIKWRTGDATSIDLVPTAPTVVHVHARACVFVFGCVRMCMCTVAIHPRNRVGANRRARGRRFACARGVEGEGMMAGEMAPDRPVINQRMSRPAFARSLKHVLIDRINSPTRDAPGGSTGSSSPPFLWNLTSRKAVVADRKNIPRVSRGILAKNYTQSRVLN